MLVFPVFLNVLIGQCVDLGKKNSQESFRNLYIILKHTGGKSLSHLPLTFNK